MFSTSNITGKSIKQNQNHMIVPPPPPKLYGASIKQDSCITTKYKKTCFEPIGGGGGLTREEALIIFSLY